MLTHDNLLRGRTFMNGVLKNKPRVGMLFDKRGDPPYQSVGKLWTETVNIIKNKFKAEVFEVDDFYVKAKA